MKERSKLRIMHPSAHAGNRIVRNGLRSSIAATAMLLAACSTGNTIPEATPVTQTSVTPPTEALPAAQPETSKNPLNTQVQVVAEDFAAKILADYQKPSSEFKYPPAAQKDGSFSIITGYNAEETLPDPITRGGYSFIATMKKDAQGNFDPSTVSEVEMSIDVTVPLPKDIDGPGPHAMPGPSVVYYFSLEKSLEHTWSITQSHTPDMNNLPNEPSYQTFRADTAYPDGNEQFSAIDESFFKALANQAETVYNLATPPQGVPAPISSAPPFVK